MGNTYKYIKQVMQLFFLDPKRAQRFEMEFEDQMAVLSEGSDLFPFVFAALISAEENEGVTTFVFDLYCWDLMDEGRANVLDAVSDTHQILRDFYKWLEDDGDEFIIVTSPYQIDALNNGLLDSAVGNVIRGLTLEVPSVDPCEIPTTEAVDGEDV